MKDSSTWQSLCEIEPRLAALEAEVRSTPQPFKMDAYWQSWNAYKRRLVALAGWEAELSALRTGDAFCVAHDHLLRVFEDAAHANNLDAQGERGAA